MAVRTREATFTHQKRRDQFVQCMIDAIVEGGYQDASVAEVARRAGVSKGVVSYHFPARDDLIYAVVAHLFDTIKKAIEPRLAGVQPVEFPAAYIEAWVDYFRTQTRNMLAVREIWGNFRDVSGKLQFGPDAAKGELDRVAEILAKGQASGELRAFDPKIMAASMKGALDQLLNRLAREPELDLDVYGSELVALFARATRTDPDAG